MLELTRQMLEKHIKPGISTLQLDELAYNFILNLGATPSFKGYHGFPGSLCTSINEVVVHGIPSKKDVLKEGDIINIDVTTILNGYFGDTSATYPVGKVSQEAKLLIERTKKSLDLAIKSVKASKYLNECVGRVIENYITPFGYSVVRDLGGHGVGLKFHEDPFVFHHYTPENHILLKSGMIFTIEPMINSSENWHVYQDKNDGWTIRTEDGSLSAQFEHTVLVTEFGAEVLTKI